MEEEVEEVDVALVAVEVGEGVEAEVRFDVFFFRFMSFRLKTHNTSIPIL